MKNYRYEHLDLINKCEKEQANIFAELEEIALYNQDKVLQAFKNNRIALRHFSPTTGYGYGDEGRDALNNLYSEIFNTEQAIASPNILSGTHAISLCLYGVLRPNDLLLSISGKPYETLIGVIDDVDTGSLRDFGVEYQKIELLEGDFNYQKISDAIHIKKPKIVYIQRSRGYEWRSALTITQIKKVIDFLRELNYNGCIMVDNCYGEFTDFNEPTDVGADLIAGSMNKNVGGGIAQTGGYVAGKSKYVQLVSSRLTAPSIRGEVGSYAFTYQYLFQGLFIAPHTVMQAMKSSVLFGSVFEKLGYDTSPDIRSKPQDLIRAINFNDETKLIEFINSIQGNSPVDSYVYAQPSSMPGYKHQVIMASGCFVQGASIELSADAPIKPPYIAYLQGGLTYEHCKIALLNILKSSFRTQNLD